MWERKRRDDGGLIRLVVLISTLLSVDFFAGLASATRHGRYTNDLSGFAVGTHWRIYFHCVIDNACIRALQSLLLLLFHHQHFLELEMIMVP